MDNTFTSYKIEERSYVAFIKREIHNELKKAGMPSRRTAEIDIIVSEITSNMVKHAGSGELLYRIAIDGTTCHFDLLAIDSGEGIADVLKALKDGVSSTNTLGHGLGSMKRLSDTFQIYSLPKWGTICYVKVSSVVEKATVKKHELDFRALFVPKPNETHCGDGYAVRKNNGRVNILFADGLGHGEHARQAVVEARNFFFETELIDPTEILREMHGHVRKTRGLVATVVSFDQKADQWEMCGVGNITTRLYSGLMYKNYMAYNGIVGLNIPTSMKTSLIPFEKNHQLIMCSDGIKTRWDISKYPSISKYDGLMLAAALYKDFTRRNDDASVLVGKIF